MRAFRLFKLSVCILLFTALAFVGMPRVSAMSPMSGHDQYSGAGGCQQQCAQAVSVVGVLKEEEDEDEPVGRPAPNQDIACVKLASITQRTLHAILSTENIFRPPDRLALHCIYRL